jgi:peptidoglycan/LPS O-acetylase OafA/YrhL
VEETRLDKALLKNHLPSLDGIRAISILAVMLYHSFGFMGARLGVSAFFVLSGFLITWLLLKEFSKTDDVSLKGFYYRRTLRIFPAYFSFLIVVFIIEMLQGDESIADFILPSFFYYYNYYYPITGNGHPNLGHIWSLCVEEQFYIIWPLVFMLTARRGQNYIISFLVLVILAGVLWRYYAYFGLELSDKWLYRTFDSRFDNLAIGCLLAVILNNKTLRDKAWGLLDYPALMPFFVVALVLSRLLGMSDPAYSYTLGFTVEGVLISLILVQCLAYSHTWYLGWLNNRFIVFIGVISYAMYLYHELAAGVALKASAYLSNILGISIGQYVAGFMGFVLTVIAAYFSYLVIEKPILRMRNRKVFASATETV